MIKPMSRTAFRLTVLLLCILFAIGITGCSDSAGTGATGTPAAAQTSGTTQAPAATQTAEELYFNETGYPIVDEPITMTMMINFNNSRAVEPSNNSVFQYLEELTGIHWDMIEVESSAWNEKKNLTLAGGDLPEIFYNGITMAEIMAQAKIGAFVDMRENIEKYAPAVTALMDKNASVKSAMVMPDGSIRSFVWTNMEIEAGMGKCPPDYLAVNQKWMDQLGLTMPSDASELYDVLVAFRDDDPNGNGKADEIPLAPRSGASSLKLTYAWFGGMFGTNDLYLTDEGTVVYGPFMDEYKDWIHYMITLYDEKLIDQELFTMTSQQIAAKGSGEDDIYGAVISSGQFTVVGEAKNPDFGIAPVFTAPNGDQIWFNRTYANAGVFCMTRECQYPEAAVRWADLFYTDEFVGLVWMGIEGEAYEMNADGSWDWIYKEGETSNDVRANRTIQVTGQGPSMCPVEWFNINDAVEGPVNEMRRWMAANYGDCLREALPNMYYEAEDQKRVSDIATDLNAYHTQMMASFITGEVDFDAEYDNFVATCKQMGAEEMVSIVQKTYEANAGN